MNARGGAKREGPRRESNAPYSRRKIFNDFTFYYSISSINGNMKLTCLSVAVSSGMCAKKKITEEGIEPPYGRHKIL